MKKYIAVFRCLDKKGKSRYGYTWLKKRSRKKILDTVHAKAESGERVVDIWSVDWTQDPHQYVLEYGTQKLPEQDFVPMVRGNTQWRQRGKKYTERKKEEPQKEVRLFTQRYYKLVEAPVDNI